MKPILAILVVVLVALICCGDAKRKRKFDGDFEFAEEDEIRSNKSGQKKTWIHDPSSDLCRPLNCEKKEICLLEDAFTSVCVSRKELKKNGDIVIPKSASVTEESKEEDDDVFYDSEDDPENESDESTDSIVCKPCPVVKPIFLCGSDNRTYSSLCRLDYHNCIHRSGIRVGCKGFCPCQGNATFSSKRDGGSKNAIDNDERLRKKQHQSEKLNTFMNKYKATLDKSGSGGSISGGKPSRNPTKSDAYAYTPQDFKYDNKHYKYIKYTKYNKEKNNVLYAEDKERLRGYNEVTENKIYNGPLLGTPIYPPKQCSSAALQAMGNRLLDWFSVVMSDSAKRRRMKNKSKVHFPTACKGEARWMFQHLDADGDARLSAQELYDLEHDQSEACLRPFLRRCDADRDGAVTASEWCRCFQRAERPCAAVKRQIAGDLLGVYVPDCDSQGYYNPVQCHAAIGMCWCVDKHGVESPNSRTHGKPNCDSNVKKSVDFNKQISTNAVENASDDEDGEDAEQDLEGSADRPNDY
ncbi:unnamed protein product [Phaedon cochleariae]|uniref:Proteoglycan Cow n=1 Tax=Phaedon cochleariae TaxID=80249 RepID=A0A9P0DRP4_PHACE|nr:unnamed protein product [Phaedon cochleariae]